MSHEMQHETAPTWCKWCGRFDVYCRADDECKPRELRMDGRPRFDFDDDENAVRQFRAMFAVVPTPRSESA